MPELLELIGSQTQYTDKIIHPQVAFFAGAAFWRFPASLISRAIKPTLIRMKKISIFTFVLVLALTSAVHAQNPKLELPKSTLGVSAGMLVFPEEEGNNYTYHQVNPRAGFDVDFHFLKRSTLSTGLYVQSVGYKAEFNWRFIDAPRFPYPVKEDIRLELLDVPLLYQYRFLRTRRLGFYSTVGVVPSVLLHSSGAVIYSDNSQIDPKNISLFNLSLFGGIGMVCQLSQNSFIKLEPAVRQYRSGFEHGFDIMDTQRLAYFLNMSFLSRIDWKCCFKKGAWKPLPRCE